MFAVAGYHVVVCDALIIAFPLPSMETGTSFLVFQSDLAAKRAWCPIFFIAQFGVTHENALLCKIKKNLCLCHLRILDLNQSNVVITFDVSM